MNSIIRPILSALFVGALLAGQPVPAQNLSGPTILSKTGSPVLEPQRFEIGLFMGLSGKVNLTLQTRQSERVMVVLRNTQNTIIHREFVKRSRNPYWFKFNFNNAILGTYQLEITDGHRRLVRQIEVVDVPAVAPQRYIVYNPQLDRY